jgi:hypothetical protein
MVTSGWRRRLRRAKRRSSRIWGQGGQVDVNREFREFREFREVSNASFDLVIW